MYYLLFCLISVPSVFCKLNSENIASYNVFISQVINFQAIQEKIQKSFWNTEEGRLTALKMFDASTKIPNGLAAGSAFDLGNFDECYGIEYEDIYGKYCLGVLPSGELSQTYSHLFGINMTQKRSSFSLHPQPRLVGIGDQYMGFHFAACVPSNWSATDIPGLLTYTEDFCYSKATEPSLSTGAIITIVVLSIFLVIIVASTAFDIFLYYKKKESPHELLLAFSFLSNGRKLFRSSTNPDQLLCLNGIKAISMMWVIIGHSYNRIMTAPLSNIYDVEKWMTNAANMFIIGATVSVDTFFAVGGLVTVYTYLKARDKGIKFNIILFYVHRYLRLTPVLIILALIHLFLLNYVSNGPLWKVVDLILVKSCEDAWWSTILYITNYVQRGSCIPPTWYLSVDMQLFVLSPLILIPLTKWPKVGFATLGILAVAGCVVPFAVGYSENLGSMVNADSEVFTNVYYNQTYTRFGPYVIGMIFGIFIYRLKKTGLRIKLTWYVVCIAWFVCLIGLTACVYAGYDLNNATEEDRWGNSMFLAFNRPAWSVAVSGVIFLCVAGYGGPIDGFLSLPIFQFLTKVSYSMYLMHATVITIRYSSMKNIIKFSDLALMHTFWGDFVVTLLLSSILCLSFESPVIILEKYIFGHGSPGRSKGGKKPIV